MLQKLVRKTGLCCQQAASSEGLLTEQSLLRNLSQAQSDHIRVDCSRTFYT